MTETAAAWGAFAKVMPRIDPLLGPYLDQLQEQGEPPPRFSVDGERVHVELAFPPRRPRRSTPPWLHNAPGSRGWIGNHLFSRLPWLISVAFDGGLYSAYGANAFTQVLRIRPQPTPDEWAAFGQALDEARPAGVEFVVLVDPTP